MRLIVFLLMAVMVGYLSGLMAEVAVEGEYSKVQSLVNTGEFNERWIPFNLSPKINEFVATYAVLSASMGFLDNAEMSDLLAFDSASIDFVIETVHRMDDGTKYLVNRISECVFETDDFVVTTCIVCLLKNSTGDLIAKGQIDFPLGFNGVEEGPLSIPMMEYDTTHNLPLAEPKDITDVRIVHAVSLAICEEEGTEGCSAKFWYKNKKQWPSAYDPKDKFLDVFEDINVEIKIGKKTDPTLKDALKAKGKTNLEFLAREAVAALLNAEHTAVHYPLLSEDIIDSTAVAINTENSLVIVQIAEEFADLNEEGCLLEKCKCDGVTRLKLEYTYTGSNSEPVDIMIEDNETFLNVDSTDEFVVFPPAGKTEFKSNTIFHITNSTTLDETIAIHTSCSRAIAVGQTYTDDETTLTIIELDQTFKSHKGEVCPLAPLKCEGVESMKLEYFGGTSPVTITVHEKASDLPFDTFTGITTNELFDVVPPTGKDEFKSNTIFKIYDGLLVDEAKRIDLATKHTSCSKPIAVDDEIGSFLVITELELVFE